MKLTKKRVLALAVTILFLILVFKNIDIKTMLNTIKSFNLNILWLLVPVYTFSYFVRGARWQQILPNASGCNKNELWQIYTTGAALNIFLPARAGDFFRAYHLGEAKNISKMEVLGSIVLERIFDGITVVSLLIIAILFSQTKGWIVDLTITGGLIFFTALFVSLLILKYNKTEAIKLFFKNKTKLLPQKFQKIATSFIERMSELVNSFITGFKNILEPKKAIKIGLYSIAVWGLECLMPLLLFVGFNLKAGLIATFFVIGLTALSTIIPSTSIYIGPYQYAYIMALAMYSINKSQALAVAFTQQFITIIIVSVIATYFFLRNGFNVKEIVKK
ncbi:MAG: lysylphosphatidylglycerol synthase transmembrane domain-containing protein [Candidatus Gastranaerophilales bacterium]|nr:lysylphosphatidylglycerol synthase transmembrane domain-containing protein [Candidatus Gastranaerophilales bacterium]